MDNTPLTSDQRAWFSRINTAVLKHMNGPTYDASHDYEHIVRVVKNAHRIWLAEKQQPRARDIDPLVMYTAALVHDIGAEKYRVKYDVESRTTIRAMLDALDVPDHISHPAAHIASFVSFTREINNDSHLKLALAQFPAFRIVQDADRLDALGAMGIARAAVYGGVSGVRRHDTILSLVALMDERFVHYAGRMKTDTGREEAERAWAFMLEFWEGMLREADCEGVI
ncbi:hypothetical protein BKA63DRAFT_576096, partial [Paraphoma chrysanthemicola]